MQHPTHVIQHSAAYVIRSICICYMLMPPDQRARSTTTHGRSRRGGVGGTSEASAGGTNRWDISEGTFRRDFPKGLIYKAQRALLIDTHTVHYSPQCTMYLAHPRGEGVGMCVAVGTRALCARAPVRFVCCQIGGRSVKEPVRRADLAVVLAVLGAKR